MLVNWMRKMYLKHSKPLDVGSCQNCNNSNLLRVDKHTQLCNRCGLEYSHLNI
jgi:hypothetical protein